MHHVTNLQLQKLYRIAYGVRFDPAREIIKARQISHDEHDTEHVMIVTVKSRVRLLSREDRVTHHGMRTIKLTLITGTDSYTVNSDDTIWLELPQPIIVAHWQVKNTPQRVAADNLAWNLCDRPGASSWVGGTAWRLSDQDSRDRRAQLMTYGV